MQKTAFHRIPAHPLVLNIFLLPLPRCFLSPEDGDADVLFRPEPQQSFVLGVSASWISLLAVAHCENTLFWPRRIAVLGSAYLALSMKDKGQRGRISRGIFLFEFH